MPPSRYEMAREYSGREYCAGGQEYSNFSGRGDFGRDFYIQGALGILADNEGNAGGVQGFLVFVNVMKILVLTFCMITKNLL